MCGRFTLSSPVLKVKQHFGLQTLDPFPARYNIAPTQPILVVMAGERADGPSRRALLVRWGLIPAWSEGPQSVPLLFNARAETAGERNAFRAALRYRRCLVPADGFYEWQKRGKGRSQPFFVRPEGDEPIAFAGLMETFLAPDGSEIDTAAILTTNANETLAPIHERMPVVIGPEGFERWLDCRGNEPADVADLMRPAPNELFTAVPVSDAVNSVANMGPDIQRQQVLPPDEPRQSNFGF